METERDTVCPWCHTEIVWDPEIGPEENCPHCYNELGEYRSINLTVKQTGQPVSFDEDDDEEEDELLDDEDIFAYEETVQRLLDEQEETPECTSCHEYMLLAGSQVIAAGTFTPAVHALIAKPLLQAPFTIKHYVCPTCFKVEQMLSEEARTAMIDTLKSV
ncbi:hypothetical protein [Paenibacillus thalictri]|uniref:Uncharacterized protein n=1 Tax=Paenibacillus thalictri TaxID=2527873 RepID=A0A4Q9DJ94_9BACL|nr:hypothetical protein [Paenibacillus thalictri]TBL71420.1 hypothetical protein EYB31_30495 [Paenibacillus thalictri]